MILFKRERRTCNSIVSPHKIIYTIRTSHMVTKLPRIGFILVLFFYFFHFLFFWVHEGTDSFFYWAFSNFLKTGSYSAPNPYFYNVPSTMEPPLYGVFLYLFQFFSRADILIHFIHVLSIGGSALLIVKIMKHYMGEWGYLVGILFLLVPSHLIYMSLLVAEPMAIFFLSLYLYTLFLVLIKHKYTLLPYLCIYSSIISLHRYNFLPYFLVTCLLTFAIKKKIPHRMTGIIVGVFVLVFWIFINHSLNGAWSMSNSEGKHLYNRIVHFDRLLPPADNPSLIRLKGYIGSTDIFLPWFFIEPLVMPHVSYSETESSKLMEEVAIAAFFSNPLVYFANTPKYFLFAHDTNNTYSSPIHLWDTYGQGLCRTLGTITFCQPIIDTQLTRHIWNILVGMTDFYYLHISRLIHFFILFPAILFSFVQRDRFIRFVGMMYVFSILFFVMTEAPLPRYLYNFSQLRVILIGYFLYTTIVFFKNKLRH